MVVIRYTGNVGAAATLFYLVIVNGRTSLEQLGQNLTVFPQDRMPVRFKVGSWRRIPDILYRKRNEEESLTSSCRLKRCLSSLTPRNVQRGLKERVKSIDFRGLEGQYW